MANEQALQSVAATQVAGVYQAVIDDVIEKMRKPFLNEGLDDQVLNDLRVAWMLKLEEQQAVAQATQAQLAPTAQSTQSQPQSQSQGRQPDGEEGSRSEERANVAAGQQRHGPSFGEGGEEFNSDDDDEDEMGEDVEEPDNYLLCRHDRLTRRTTTYRTLLRHGIMQVEGRDFMFGKMQGEFTW